MKVSKIIDINYWILYLAARNIIKMNDEKFLKRRFKYTFHRDLDFITAYNF